MAIMPIERGKIREYATATAAARPAYLDDPKAPVPPTFLGDWHQIFRVNLIGTALMERACLELAVPGAAAVFVSSSAGHLAEPPARDIVAVLDDPLTPGFFGRLDEVVPKDEQAPLHAASRPTGKTGTVRTVTPVPRVLPYDECPLAVRNVTALAGLPLGELRGAVLERLWGPLGCTHLNDMLRALADVPVLARHLPAAAVDRRLVRVYVDTWKSDYLVSR